MQSETSKLNKLWSEAKQRCTPEALADGHPFQLQLLTPSGKNIVLICSRRAGKTAGLARLLLLTAMRTDNVSCLYLALVSRQAKKVFNGIWRRLLKKYKVPHIPSETELSCTFPNGSVVTFGGVDDLRHVQTLLGDSMAGGLAVIDEAQSGDSSVLRSLAVDVLSPMLDETNIDHPEPGRLCVSGTVPNAPVGFLYELYTQPQKVQEAAPGELTGNELDTGPWLRLKFSRFDNPHLTNNEQRLSETLEKYGLTKDDPWVRRNWYGDLVWSISETAYRYDSNRAGFVPVRDTTYEPSSYSPGLLNLAKVPPGIDSFCIGIDPAATSDRMCVILWGWSSLEPKGLWHIGEWTTPKAADALESEWLAVVQMMVSRYNVVGIIRDAGSASTTLDPAFLSEYGLVIEPAKKGKGSKKARVDRLADLLGRGRAHVMIGSELEKDLILARFDVEARSEGKYEWTSDCHPDVADAATYAVPVYIESTKKPPRKTQEQKDTEEEKAIFSQPAAPYGYQDPEAQPDYGDDPSYGGPSN